MDAELLERTLSRRSGLLRGAKAAFVAPAVVAALRSGVAFADSGSGHRGSGNSGSGGDDHSSGDHGTGDQRTPEVAGVQTANQVATATQTHTATGTATHAEVDGLNALFSGQLKSLPLANTSNDSDNKGAAFFFGANGLTSRIFVRFKRLQRSTTYRLVYLTSGDPVSLVQFTTNPGGAHRSVTTVNNLNLAFASLTFVLQRLDGSTWTSVAQLVKHA
jgi:hypothetical protein